MTGNVWFWAFNAGVILLLALDLLAVHHRGREMKIREAGLWSLGWVAASLALNGVIWAKLGPQRAIEFLTGYIIEYSLSVDNLFVFLVCFSYFSVPPAQQRRVLFWGILGALVMRGVIIGLGIHLVSRFNWTLYLMGAFLLYTGVKLFLKSEETLELEENAVLRFCRKHFRVASQYHGPQFFVKIDGAWMLTPLALVLIVIEVMDILFAVDSIPAVFAVTRHPFIVYSSNICAILGLRSLYFVLAPMANHFVYLKYGIAAVLSFVGGKMLLGGMWHVPTWGSLAIVALCLLTSVVASLVATRKTRDLRSREGHC